MRYIGLKKMDDIMISFFFLKMLQDRLRINIEHPKKIYNAPPCYIKKNTFLQWKISYIAGTNENYNFLSPQKNKSVVIKYEL